MIKLIKHTITKTTMLFFLIHGLHQNFIEERTQKASYQLYLLFKICNDCSLKGRTEVMVAQKEMRVNIRQKWHSVVYAIWSFKEVVGVSIAHNQIISMAPFQPFNTLNGNFLEWRKHLLILLVEQTHQESIILLTIVKTYKMFCNGSFSNIKSNWCRKCQKEH